MMMEAGGTRILMDPWLVDPTYHGTWWHYPPLVHRPADLPKIDYLYISHEHPDHFDPPTLAQLDKNVQVLIANFRRKRFRDRIREIGFRNIRELDFGEDFALNGSGLVVRLVPPDRPWDDSAVLVKSNGTTVFNCNDCHLDEATLRRLGTENQIDLAFLTFTGASQYPGCFEFPLETKVARWRESKHSHLDEFVSWAKLLQTRSAVPAAGNVAFLQPDQLFMNTPDYVNTPAEAVALLHERAPEIEGLQMNPGDVWTRQDGLQRHAAPPDWSQRLAEIDAMSAARREEMAADLASEPEAPADLFDRFRDYFSSRLQADPELAPRINIVTWWVVEGAAGGNWVIDFTRDKDWVYAGVPEKWNLRLTWPERLVYKGVSGLGIWDDLVLSFRLRLARDPDTYKKEFWTWLCKL